MYKPGLASAEQMAQNSQLHVLRNWATSSQRELLGRRYNYGEKASL